MIDPRPQRSRARRRLARADRVRTSGAIRHVVFDRHNERMKVYGLASASELASSSMVEDATAQGLTKVIVYARGGSVEEWQSRGFVPEGVIRGYFVDGADASIFSRFLDDERSSSERHDEHERFVATARGCGPKPPSLADGYTCEVASPEDAPVIAGLMRGIFTEYPDPISANWVVASMTDRSRHFRVVRDPSDAIVASASAEIDWERRSAELTDCATDPSARGRGIMRAILAGLERDMVAEGITDLYTLARADELAMNCAFAKLGWSYTGRLVNNCRMPNGWESMNIWCRG